MDNNFEDINQNIQNDEIKQNEMDFDSQNVMAENNDLIEDDSSSSNIVQNEPTVTFDAVEISAEHSNNIGIKVFFALVSVMIAIIMAVAVGYIFGKNNGERVFSFTSPNNLISKGEAVKHSNYTEVFNEVKASVVCITVYSENDSAQGYASGLIYSSDGYIVINDHLYSEIKSPKFLVTMYDGKEYSADFVAGDIRSDLAVLKINANNLTPVTFGNYNEVIVGEEVVAIGYPFGAAEGTILTVGTVSSVGTRVKTTSSYEVKMIQTDTAINPGSSGGALVNMYSQVIGITSAKMVGTSYDSVGYAIPSSTVVKVVDSLIKKGYVEGRGKLGITYTEIDSVASVKRNLPKGMEIVEITKNSDLYGKNIKAGDVITHINDIELINNNVALDIIDITPPGQPISLTVYRPSTDTTETVYVSLIPDPGSSSYSNNVLPEDNNIFDDNDDFFSDH